MTPLLGQYHENLLPHGKVSHERPVKKADNPVLFGTLNLPML